jgi:hypothetical protein
LLFRGIFDGYFNGNHISLFMLVVPDLDEVFFDVLDEGITVLPAYLLLWCVISGEGHLVAYFREGGVGFYLVEVLLHSVVGGERVCIGEGEYSLSLF